MNLIETLKQEHCEILSLVNAFKKGQGFPSKKWREALFSAKKLFIEHLEKEDDILYPALRKTGISDKATSEMTEKFISEMKDISRTVISFLDRYAVEQSGPDFSRDYANIVSVLEKRISEEESVLFEKYRQLF
ncbi:MAG: hemerythrin domain-containing protein [Spirochaetota bacterium]